MSKKAALQAVVMDVTPEMAAEWLSVPSTNRNLSQGRVDVMAADFANGGYVFTGDSIKLNGNGAVIDGQHRLWAIVQSGVTCTMLVVSGLNHAEVFTRCDQHAKRSMSDMFSIAGEQNVTTMAAVTYACCCWDKFGVPVPVKTIPAHSQMEYFTKHADEMRAGAGHACGSDSRNKLIGLPGSVVGASYVILGRIDREDRDTFLAKAQNGTGLSEDSPIYRLRLRLLQNRNATVTKLNRKVIYALLFRAWNHYRAGNTLRSLVWRPETEAFPVPV